MNLNPFILAALKRVGEVQKKPFQEIMLRHNGKTPTFNKFTVVPKVGKVAEDAEAVRKQLVQAKLCLLGKDCQGSLARRGMGVLGVRVRFEEGKKPTWTVEVAPTPVHAQ